MPVSFSCVDEFIGRSFNMENISHKVLRTITPAERAMCLVAIAAITAVSLVLFGAVGLATYCLAAHIRGRKDNVDDVQNRYGDQQNEQLVAGVVDQAGPDPSSVDDGEFNTGISLEVLRNQYHGGFATFYEGVKSFKLEDDIAQTIMNIRNIIIDDVETVKNSGVDDTIMTAVYQEANESLQNLFGIAEALKNDIDTRTIKTQKADAEKRLVFYGLKTIACLRNPTDKHIADFLKGCIVISEMQWNVNEFDFSGLRGQKETLLHRAAKMGQLGRNSHERNQLLRAISNCGASFTVQEKADRAAAANEGGGNTPLVWAVANAMNEFANDYLDFMKGFDFDIKCLGNTALHLAIVKGYKKRSFHAHDKDDLTVSNLELVEKMINRGANLEIYNASGYTALHIACLRRDPDMIRALINGHANTSALTMDNRSCVDLVKNFTHVDISEIMRKTTCMFLLPEEAFNDNKQACIDLLESQSAAAAQ